MESIGSGLEELGKRVQCFLLFSAGTIPELGLLREEGNRTRKQRMWNKRTWPSHVFTSFARSSINTFVSEALDLERNKTQDTHWGEGVPGMTCRQQTHSALGGMEKGKKKKPFLCRGGINNLLELFHTLPLSLGIAELCKDCPSASSCSGTAHFTPRWAHTPMATVTCQAVDTALLGVETLPALPTELHQSLAGSSGVFLLHLPLLCCSKEQEVL